ASGAEGWTRPRLLLRLNLSFKEHRHAQRSYAPLSNETPPASRRGFPRWPAFRIVGRPAGSCDPASAGHGRRVSGRARLVASRPAHLSASGSRLVRLALRRNEQLSGPKGDAGLFHVDAVSPKASLDGGRS